MKTYLTLALLASLLVACGGSGGSGGDAAIDDGRIALSSAKPGTCVAIGDDTFVNRVPEVPCTGGTEMQVAGFTKLEGGSDAAYPGWHGTDSAGYDLCQPVFDKFTGTAFWDSSLDIVAVTPSASTWRRGDRLVTCLIVRPT